MKISGRVKNVTIKGARWSCMVGREWVSQFFNENLTPDLKVALESVKDGETWEFETADLTKDGKTYHNAVGAARIPDTGQDDNVQPRGQEGRDDRSEHIARSAALHDAATVVAALIALSKKEYGTEEMITIAKRLSHFILTGE